MASRRQSNPPTEPTPVSDLFVTAVALDGSDEYVRLTGMVAHELSHSPLTGNSHAERRIVARMVMPRSTARQLLVELQRKLPRENA